MDKAPAKAYQPPKIEDVRARVRANIQTNPHLAKLEQDRPGHAITWLMAEEWRVSQGGISPIFLRPLVVAEYYGDSAINRLLTEAQHTLETVRPFLTQVQMMHLDIAIEGLQTIAQNVAASKHMSAEDVSTGV